MEAGDCALHLYIATLKLALRREKGQGKKEMDSGGSSGGNNQGKKKSKKRVLTAGKCLCEIFLVD